MKTVIVSGSFDDMRARDIRFLQEASRYGYLHALVWGDDFIEGRPKFPQEERMYMMDAIRYVDRATLVTELGDKDGLPDAVQADVWVVDERDDTPQRRHFCGAHNIAYRVLTSDDVRGFPIGETADGDENNKKVIVTGCFDWFHSGHIRFLKRCRRWAICTWLWGTMPMSVCSKANIIRCSMKTNADMSCNPSVLSNRG